LVVIGTVVGSDMTDFQFSENESNVQCATVSIIDYR
jgi:hypothetical protein